MPRPIQAVIDSEAVRYNLARVKERVSPSRVWAVVKADAYGHGIERIFPALAQAALDDVCTGGNPREATLEDIVELYHTAW